MASLDLKLRYQNSKIGIIWSLLKPLMQFFAYYLAFGVILKVSDEPDYALRLFLGVLLWTFFAEATSNGLNCYISKKVIITKVKINKFILPLSSYLTALFNYALTMVIFSLVYIVYLIQGKVVFNLNRIMAFLLFFIGYSLFIVSVNVILANLNVLFRDIQTLWELVLMFGVFLTPIMYSLNIDEKYLGIYYSANPLALPIEQMRSLFFKPNDCCYSIKYTLLYFAVIGAFIVLAVFVDNKFKKKVSDYL